MGDEFEKLVEKYDKMIWKFVHRYINYNVLDKEDLYQAGLFGLWKAKCKFDPEKGVSFTTFAYRYIQGWMSNELRKQLETGISRSEIEILNKIKREELNWDLKYDHLFNLAKGLKDIDEYDYQIAQQEVEEQLIEKEWFRLLDEKEKVVINLKYEKGYKNKEIAKVLNFSGTYISTIEKKAFIKIKKFYEEAS